MPKVTGYLKQIFNNSLSIGYYLTHFRKFVIIIHFKLGGTKNYTNLKNCRLISLLNIIIKIIKTIIAARISYIV